MRLVISPSNARPLPHSDPAGRQTWVSIGAFVANIELVVETLPLKMNIAPKHDRVVLTFLPIPGVATRSNMKRAITTILDRQSNRNPFKIEALNNHTVGGLRKSFGKRSSVQTVLVSGRPEIEKLSELTRRATLLAFSARDFRRELFRHINPPYQPRPSGIPARTISRTYSGPWIEKLLGKTGGFSSNLANREAKRMARSALVALVFTPGDTRRDWLVAGREYERLCLRATELGLSHSTHAALVEAPDYHKDVAELVGNNMRLQAVVRLGHGVPARVRAQRLPLENVLHILDDAS